MDEGIADQESFFRGDQHAVSHFTLDQDLSFSVFSFGGDGSKDFTGLATDLSA